METEVTKQQMDSLKALSDTNLKISEARNALFKLQEDETVYLEAREKKAMDRITKVLEDSQKILGEVKSNYEEVKTLYSTASGFAQFLVEAQEKFSAVIESVHAKNELWEKSIQFQEEELALLRRDLSVEKVQIANDKKSIVAAQKTIEKEKAHIESRQLQIKSALDYLKKKS